MQPRSAKSWGLRWPAGPLTAVLDLRVSVGSLANSPVVMATMRFGPTRRLASGTDTRKPAIPNSFYEPRTDLPPQNPVHNQSVDFVAHGYPTAGGIDADQTFRYPSARIGTRLEKPPMDDLRIARIAFLDALAGPDGVTPIQP